jgi:hypothetical protein
MVLGFGGIFRADYHGCNFNLRKDYEMTKKIGTGGSAFPHASIDVFAEEGMTLRDYFAGQALADGGFDFEANPSRAASACYKVADAFIAARNAKPEGEA